MKRLTTKRARKYLRAVLDSLLLISATTWAEGPKYAAKVPDSVKTPDKVHTELLGDLEFFDGAPSKATVKKAYDFLDFSRGANPLNQMLA